MTKRTLFTSVLLLFSFFIYSQERPLSKGMKITRSVKIRKAVYNITGIPDTSVPVIVIEGNNIIVDFNNAELRGSNRMNRPFAFTGIAVMVRNSSNVTLRNLKAKGYKIALRATNTENLVVENCDFSYNYRPQLNSTQEKEDISDWMSYHHNENDEWMRYGAAIYLRDCPKVIIRNCKVTGGQNALMMTSCNEGVIYNNDFSFNSGIGIAMYRSSRNKVLYNRLIFNVRGYSHGVYNRGQDSAGILVYEQSNENLFYKNNATHSGDGFFLWAGQTTMETGTGGSNDNVLLENDFSYAPTNGIEVTFSRNQMIRNRVFECDHGIWGGYSYQSSISGNHFRDNRIAIAIEHGQDISISGNLFAGDKEAIRLWARKEQPADWIYAQKKDTRSKRYAIVSNSFNNHSLVYNISRTDSLSIFDNTYSEDIKSLYKVDSTVTNLDSLFDQRWADSFSRVQDHEIPVIAKPMDPFSGTGKFKGRKNILITEWGPYDYRYPIIWNTNPKDTSGIMEFDLIGPKGKWVIKKSRGVRNIDKRSGTFPASIKAEKIPESRTDILIELEYKGDPVVTAFGEKIAANKLYSFSFRKFFQPMDWEVMFFAIDTNSHNPIKTGSLFSPVERRAPVKTEKVKELNYAWWGGIKVGDQVYPQFVTTAETVTDFPPGSYELSVTWDDAIRIYLDEKLILDEWNPGKYKFDESPNRKIPLIIKGKHNIRVEHVELGGFATLQLKLRPAL